MADPTTWDAGDFHHWERPTNPPCPNCVCCSAALCKKAIDQDSACHFEGHSPDYNLADCPCWRKANAEKLRTEHGETVNPSYLDPRGLSRNPQERSLTMTSADPTTTPTLDLDAIRAREQAATDGPWWAWDRGVGYVIALGKPTDIDQYERPARELPEGMRTDIGREADAEFIAHARTDVLALLSEVDRLRSQVAFYEGPQKQPGLVSLVPHEQRAPLYAAYKAAHDWAERNGTDHTDDAMIQAAVKAYRAELVARAKHAGTEVAAEASR